MNTLQIVKTWPQWAQDDFEERAAIKEYDAGKTREQAEAEAYELVKIKVGDKYEKT